MNLRTLACLSLISLWGSCDGPLPWLHASDPSIAFEDVSSQTGIDFAHADGSSGEHFLIEAVASGLASFDYDRDGRTDVYFLNGAALQGTQYRETPVNGLYRNLGDWRFSQVPPAKGAADPSYSLGVAIGDYDNDGFEDIFISNFGPNTLFRNNGDGTFSQVDAGGTTACGDKTGGGASMVDIDADGNLDIYAASYIEFSYDVPATVFRGRKTYGGPLLYPKEADNLLHNQGNGQFVDISQKSGIGKLKEWGMGTICFDFDLDGDADIFVANDSTQNFLWENDGNGSFEEVALIRGVAYDHRGDPQGSMGADVADINTDSLPDLFQTAYTMQLATLYANVGPGFFDDVTLRTGAGAGTLYPVNWGTGFADFDNDGDRDLFLANGHIHDNMDDLDDTVSYKIKNQIMQNQAGKFVDVSAECGPGLRVEESSRGSVIDDFDLDGRPDVIVLNSRTSSTILHNQSPASGGWILLDLVGVACNRSAIGARVVVQAGKIRQTLEVHSGRGYQSHFGSRLHFGVGAASLIDRIEVHWPGGSSETFSQIAPNALLLLRQGSGEPVRYEIQ